MVERYHHYTNDTLHIHCWWHPSFDYLQRDD